MPGLKCGSPIAANDLWTASWLPYAFNACLERVSLHCALRPLRGWGPLEHPLSLLLAVYYTIGAGLSRGFSQIVQLFLLAFSGTAPSCTRSCRFLPAKRLFSSTAHSPAKNTVPPGRPTSRPGGYFSLGLTLALKSCIGRHLLFPVCTVPLERL